MKYRILSNEYYDEFMLNLSGAGNVIADYPITLFDGYDLDFITSLYYEIAKAISLNGFDYINEEPAYGLYWTTGDSLINISYDLNELIQDNYRRITEDGMVYRGDHPDYIAKNKETVRSIIDKY